MKTTIVTQLGTFIYFMSINKEGAQDNKSIAQYRKVSPTSADYWEGQPGSMPDNIPVAVARSIKAEANREVNSHLNYITIFVER